MIEPPSEAMKGVQQSDGKKRLTDDAVLWESWGLHLHVHAWFCATPLSNNVMIDEPDTLLTYRAKRALRVAIQLNVVLHT